jgi:hypothetical protein
MFIEMTASALISLNAFSAHGASAEAQFIAQQAKVARRHLYESNSLGLQRRELFEELCAVAEECNSPNWDGYGAEPVSEDAYKLAYCFLEALPPGTPKPSIGAEPDGQLTIEWYRSQNNVLSVSASPEGDLHYSALVGPNKAYGTEAFFGEAPTEILALIRRVLAV